MHQGALVSLAREPGIQAVVRLTIMKGDIDASVCTGAFISRSLVLTAAHCLEGARRVYLETPQVGGYLYQPADSTEFYVSSADQDIALVRFPQDSFSGRPVDYRLMDEALLERLQTPNAWAFRTFGFGRNETGQSDDLMRSDWMPSVELTFALFRTHDRFRVDIGDSGGPVFAVSQGIPGEPGPSWIVAVNHAYDSVTPTDQFYQPLHASFFEDLLEMGVNVPTVTCDCREPTVYRREALQPNDTRRLLRRWSDSRVEVLSQPYGYLSPCAAFETEGSSYSYIGGETSDGTPIEITQVSSGRSCVARGPVPSLAQPLRGQSPPVALPAP
ncbi:MAG: trypsin-like serine protease [Bdellovibrionales bacterium]|nr:trypsin-like serine protease [Bdellovibrionales bacterium]